MKTYENQSFDQERALYASREVETLSCRFDGPADGESAFKECRNIRAQGCFFNLRYPFWHDEGVELADSELTENCRAALWYSRDVNIRNTKLHGIKALRECDQVQLEGCDILYGATMQEHGVTKLLKLDLSEVEHKLNIQIS